MAFGSRGDVRTYGGGAGAQHSQTLYAVLAHVPGLKVVVPSTARNAKGLLVSAIRDDGPVVVLEHKFLGFAARGLVPEEAYALALGKAEIVREGRDVTLCGIGRMTHVCLEAAERLAAAGVEAEVVDVLTLAPLDEETIVESVKKTTRCVTAHEAVTRGGFGAELAAVVQHGAFDWLDAPIERVGARFGPLPFAPGLEQWVVPHADDVLDAIRRTVARA
jgi:pyruvate dehydrogenase E1 component beta subunit